MYDSAQTAVEVADILVIDSLGGLSHIPNE
jgi:hypothetical protein